MANSKVALITGVTGQDGSYLAEFLLDKGYEVHGLRKRIKDEKSDQRFSSAKHIFNKITLHYGNITDYATIRKLVFKVRPDECYHLAGQRFEINSPEDDFLTFNTNLNGTHYILSALREIKPACRFYFACTSEVFGKASEPSQDEETEFDPGSSYAISKAASFYLTRMHRDSYGMFACSGILFNHESPRRGHEFVTRKITHTAAKIKLGLEKELRLGNLDAKRDWGYAGDYVEVMWLMLQQKKPKDYIISTGETHSVKEFIQHAFGYLGLDWKKYVKVDKKLLCSRDTRILRGNSSRARRDLGWKPRVSFESLVKIMVDADLKDLEPNNFKSGAGNNKLPSSL